MGALDRATELVRLKGATRATEIAAIQARYTEEAVLAEGALIAEKRAALARLAMIVMFGVITQSQSTERYLPQAAVGFAYTLFSVGVILGLRRQTRGEPRKARIMPFLMTTIDFSALSTLAVLDMAHGHVGAPAMHVVSSTIVMSFSVGRFRLYHVAWSWLLAVASLLALVTYAEDVPTRQTVFILGGYTVFAFMLAITNRAVHSMFGDLRRRDNLTRFLPQQVVDRVIRGGPDALAPVQREVSVLFSDIRGFTGLSETLEPRALLAMLDDYFGRMGQIVKGHDGVIGKFIGDGLLAYWNVPDALEGHAAKAVAAARDMQRAVTELNRERDEDGLPPIKIGIGIHTGVVAAGLMGGAQSEYTVIGDAVNVASRIEGMTKEHVCGVLISETTWDQLPATRQGRRIDAATIRGRKEPIALYALDE